RSRGSCRRAAAPAGPPPGSGRASTPGKRPRRAGSAARRRPARRGAGARPAAASPRARGRRGARRRRTSGRRPSAGTTAPRGPRRRRCSRDGLDRGRPEIVVEPAEGLLLLHALDAQEARALELLERGSLALVRLVQLLDAPLGRPLRLESRQRRGDLLAVDAVAARVGLTALGEDDAAALDRGLDQLGDLA